MSTPHLQPVQSSCPPSSIKTSFQSPTGVSDDASRCNTSPNQRRSRILTAADVVEVPTIDVDGQKQDNVRNFAAAKDFGPLTKFDNQPGPSPTFERAISMTPELDAKADMAPDPEENDDQSSERGSVNSGDSDWCGCYDNDCQRCLVYMLNARTPQAVPLHLRIAAFDLHNRFFEQTIERMTERVNHAFELHEDPGQCLSSRGCASTIECCQRYQILLENLKTKEELAREQVAYYEQIMALINGSSGLV